MKPQTRLVLNYLRSNRSLTTMIAMGSLGVASLSSRIAELRALGFKITHEWRKDWQATTRYKKYRLEAEPFKGGEHVPYPR